MGYRAFFSYSRQDDRVANWLHRGLDGFRTPKPLLGDGASGAVPEKLHPIFRDRTDMAGGGQLSVRIEEALRDSEALIVLCSPAAAASPWVNQEVETFTTLGRGERIFPIIAYGQPDTDDVERDFFPPSLRGRGLLAADLREITLPSGKVVGDGREGGRLKLIAGLLGVSLDALAQRERSRQRWRTRALGAAAAAFGVLALVAFAQFLSASHNARVALENERLAAVERDRARDALARVFAERAVEQIEAGNYQLAMRYALAGWRATPNNEGLFAPILARSLYDLPSRVQLGSETPLYHGEFSDDGNQVLTTAGVGPATVWDANTGARLFALGQQNHTFAHYVGADRIVTITADHQLDLWRTSADGAERIASLPYDSATSDPNAQTEWSESHLSADRRRLAVSEGAGVFRVYDTQSLSLVGRIDTECEQCSGQLFRDGAALIAFARNSDFQYWDVATQRRLPTPQDPRIAQQRSCEEGLAFAFCGLSALGALRNFDGGRFTADVSDNGRLFVDASTSGEVRVRQPFEEGRLFEHPSAILSARLIDNDARLLTFCRDGRMRIWDVASGRLLTNIRVGRNINGGARSRDGRRAFISEADGAGIVYDLSEAQGRTLLDAAAHANQVVSIQFSGDGARLLSMSADGAVLLWSRDGRQLARMQAGAHPRLAAFAEGGRIVTVSDAGLRVWSVEGRLLHSGNVGNGVRMTAVSPNGAYVAAITPNYDTDGNWSVREGIEVWRIATGARVARIESPTDGSGDLSNVGVSFSLDNASLIAIWADDSVAPRREYVQVVALAAPNTTADASPLTRCEYGECTPARIDALIQQGNGQTAVWSRETPSQLIDFAALRARLLPDGQRLLLISQPVRSTTRYDGADLLSGVAEIFQRNRHVEDVGTVVAMTTAEEPAALFRGRDLRIVVVDGDRRLYNGRPSVAPFAALAAGERLLLVSDDSGARIVTPGAGREILRIADAPVSASAIAPDGSRTAAGGSDGRMRMLDTREISY
ncbi:MAG: TIR domain-containing protein, partial [Hyphomonadaceae bacterium]|nr:TIR domain-containing protein [Hyphomonadaceae bacterium]